MRYLRRKFSIFQRNDIPVGNWIVARGDITSFSNYPFVIQAKAPFSSGHTLFSTLNSGRTVSAADSKNDFRLAPNVYNDKV